MGKSARLLGMEINKSAREMNQLLRQHDYLYGSPGAYGLTEKGMQFGQQQDHHRGPGGYASYNRDWTTTTWDESVLDALANDMDAQQRASEPSTSAVEDADSTYEADTDDDWNAPSEMGYERDEGDTALDKFYVWIGGAVVAVAVGIAVAPHAKRVWKNSVAPRTKRLWAKVTNSAQEDTPGEGENLKVEPAETTEPGASPHAQGQAPESDRAKS